MAEKIKEILKREKLPISKETEPRGQKLEEIKKTASKKYFDMLLKMEKEYGQK